MSEDHTPTISSLSGMHHLDIAVVLHGWKKEQIRDAADDALEELARLTDSSRLPPGYVALVRIFNDDGPRETSIKSTTDGIVVTSDDPPSDTPSEVVTWHREGDLIGVAAGAVPIAGVVGPGGLVVEGERRWLSAVDIPADRGPAAEVHGILTTRLPILEDPDALARHFDEHGVGAILRATTIISAFAFERAGLGPDLDGARIRNEVVDGPNVHWAEFRLDDGGRATVGSGIAASTTDEGDALTMRYASPAAFLRNRDGSRTTDMLMTGEMLVLGRREFVLLYGRAFSKLA